MAAKSNNVAFIEEPSGKKVESWSGSMSNGQGTVVRTIIGDAKSVANDYKTFCEKYGTITILTEEGCPFIGLQCILTAASYEELGQGSGIARASETFTTPSYNKKIEDSVADTAKRQHFETSDVSVTERNIRFAPFWLNAFKEDPETEARAWKAIQTFLDTTVESKEEAETLLDTATGFVDEGDQKTAIKKMVNLRMGGVDAFYYPVQTISVSDVLDKSSVKVGKDVGKVGEPETERIEPDSKLKWLKMSDKISWDGVSFHVEKQWAGAQSWDKDLYTDEKE